MSLYRFIRCLEAIYKGAGYKFSSTETDYYYDERRKRLVYSNSNNIHSISVWLFSNGEVMVTYCNSFKNNVYTSKWFKI